MAINNTRDGASNGNEASTSPGPLSVPSPVAVGGGFTAPVVAFPSSDSTDTQFGQSNSVTSTLASGPAIETAQMVDLSEGRGTLLYYPKTQSINIGDVFYLREREEAGNENGIIVQVIRKETAAYAQADAKALWRLLTAVRASQLSRSHHEPPETIDQFLAAKFKVRASIVNGEWTGAEGRVVTRNVDVFSIDPQMLTSNILKSNPSINLNLGDYYNQPVEISGEGFEKVNLITGMKGEGKSHLTKGIIHESRLRGMSAVIFDINNEYGAIPSAEVFTPTVNLKFRMNRLRKLGLFNEIIQRLAPFADRTSFAATAEIPRIMGARIAAKKILDIAFLKTKANDVFPGSAPYLDNMRASYLQSLNILDRHNLFASTDEITKEDAGFRSGKMPSVVTLSSAFRTIDLEQRAGVIVFSIGGFPASLQRTIVNLVLDALAGLCDLQYADWKAGNRPFPIYPTVYFEEATCIWMRKT